MALETSLNKFKELEGFILAAVVAADGRVLGSVAADDTGLTGSGESVIDLVASAQRTAKEFDLGQSNEVDLCTDKGANIFVRSQVEGGTSYYLVLICSDQTLIGLVRYRIQQILPGIAAAL